MKPMQITLNCIAEGNGDNWNAICLNFDVSVQGSSFKEVYDELNSAVVFYLETVIKEYPKEEQFNFLNRKAPFLLRAKYAFKFFFKSFIGCDGSKKDMHSFVEHTACPA